MKKFKTLFFIVINLVIAITVNASAISNTKVDTTSTVKDSTSLTFIYSDIKGSILGLAEGLKTPAEHLYKILVKQQVIKAWAGLILIIVTVIIMIISYKLLTNGNNYIVNDDGIIEGLKVKSVVGIILAIIIFVNMIKISYRIDDIVTGIINPEFGAIQNIVNIIK